jgi:hypothetical protein
MLDEVVLITVRSGIRFVAFQIVGSMHSISNVNTDEDDYQQGKGKDSWNPDESWGSNTRVKCKVKMGRIKSKGSISEVTKRVSV